METNDMPRPGARGWARVGLYGGLLLSLAGNEAHVWGDGYPGPGPAVASVIWPALLFVALEIVLHMGPGFLWAKWVGLGSVAAVSGAFSYWHLSSVLRVWDYGPLSWFGPVAVDGLMVMSTVVLARLVPVPAVPVPARVPVRVFAGSQSVPGPVPGVRPVLPERPAEPAPARPVKPAAPTPERLPQGAHMREGRLLRGPELKADAVGLVRTEGLTNDELAKKYTPPLKERTAQAFGAEARRRTNGHVPFDKGGVWPSGPPLVNLSNHAIPVDPTS